MPTTRLAPSPTGALHLGNARTFLVNWALARQLGWRVVLRIDDLDGPRIKPGATDAAIETLRWLGLDWDAGPFFESDTRSEYRAALQRLIADGHAFACRCTRSEILAASLSAPNQGDHELRYPGTCRPAAGEAIDAALLGDLLDDPSVAWRLLTPDAEVAFVDQFLGPQSINPQPVVGDFPIATKGGQASYQLAVVIDDAGQGIDRVVRGDDLLASTARQLLVYDRLGLGPIPQYWHLPMVRGEDGRRLAKRHGDTRLTTYQQQGLPAERLIGLLASWCGIETGAELSAAEFAERFELDRLPKEPIVFTADDAARLM